MGVMRWARGKRRKDREEDTNGYTHYEIAHISIVSVAVPGRNRTVQSKYAME